MTAVHDAFAPARLGSLALRNRVIKTATYEGMCPGGLPSDALVEHHRALAAGGVGLTTVAYCAGSPDGREDEVQAFAYDLSRRSTLFAEFNRRLNGIANMTAARGDLRPDRQLPDRLRPRHSRAGRRVSDAADRSSRGRGSPWGVL